MKVGVVAADAAWDQAAVELYAHFQAGEISPEQMVAELPPIWRCRSDLDPLGSDQAWRAMVDHAGYFTWRSGDTAGRRSRRPRWSRRLFRGACPERRWGMSWTTNPAIAQHFAAHRQAFDRTDGQVWVGVFAASRLLAYLRDEREYLVDASGAEVELWSPGHGNLITRLRSRT